jgi:riboflavin kinase
VKEATLLKICGRVTSGLGKGKVFLSLEPYRKALRELLGEEVYPGTLNLKVSLEEWRKIYQVSTLLIPSFILGERRYGQVKAVPVELDGKIPGAVLFPEKGIRPAILEIACPLSLRDFLALKDGDPFCFHLKSPRTSEGNS